MGIGSGRVRRGGLQGDPLRRPRLLQVVRATHSRARSLARSLARTHARTHARSLARTHARTHRYGLLTLAVDRWRADGGWHVLEGLKSAIFVESSAATAEQMEARVLSYKQAAAAPGGALLLAVMRGRYAEVTPPLSVPAVPPPRVPRVPPTLGTSCPCLQVRDLARSTRARTCAQHNPNPCTHPQSESIHASALNTSNRAPRSAAPWRISRQRLSSRPSVRTGG